MVKEACLHSAYYELLIPRRSGMARVNEGSHSFACHPHVYPQVEWTIPAFNLQPQSVAALWLVLISRPTKGRRLSWPGGCLVKYWGSLPAQRRSPILVFVVAARNWTCNHWVACPTPSPRDYRATYITHPVSAVNIFLEWQMCLFLTLSPNDEQILARFSAVNSWWSPIMHAGKSITVIL